MCPTPARPTLAPNAVHAPSSARGLEGFHVRGCDHAARACSRGRRPRCDGDGQIQQARDVPEQVQERVRPDRGPAQAASRPHPQHGRNRQGLYETRARDARSRDPGEEPGLRRPREGGAGSRERRRDRRTGGGRGCAQRYRGTPVRARGELPGSQGQPEHDAAQRGATVDRKQGRIREAGGQRQRGRSTTPTSRHSRPSGWPGCSVTGTTAAMLEFDSEQIAEPPTVSF